MQRHGGGKLYDVIGDWMVAVMMPIRNWDGQGHDIMTWNHVTCCISQWLMVYFSLLRCKLQEDPHEAFVWWITISQHHSTTCLRSPSRTATALDCQPGAVSRAPRRVRELTQFSWASVSSAAGLLGVDWVHISCEAMNKLPGTQSVLNKYLFTVHFP